jgi:hypothetical protein
MTSRHNKNRKTHVDRKRWKYTVNRKPVNPGVAPVLWVPQPQQAGYSYCNPGHKISKGGASPSHGGGSQMLLRRKRGGRWETPKLSYLEGALFSFACNTYRKNPKGFANVQPIRLRVKTFACDTRVRNEGPRTFTLPVPSPR